MAVTSWFASGILFTLFIDSLYLKNLFLKKLEERGLKVRRGGLEARFSFFKFATMGVSSFGLAILLFILPIIFLATLALTMGVILGGFHSKVLTFILIQMFFITTFLTLLFILLVKLLKKYM